MEERKVKKSTKHKNEMALRIGSVVLAVVIWIILSITMFPTISTSVYEVPVKIDLTGTFAEENGLSVVKFDEDMTVDVKLSGMRYEIGNYSAKDLVASVNVKEVYSDGTYNLAINVKSAHGDDLNVVSVSPATCNVKFDYKKTQEFPLEVEYSGISADEGYTLRTPTINEETVTITGPENEIEKIAKVAVKVKGGRLKLTETYTTENTELVLYSENGTVLKDDNLEFSHEQFKVTFQVYNSKTVPLTLNIKQTGDNFDISSLKYTIEPENITIYSSKAISDVQEVNVGTIDLNDIDFSEDFEFELSLDNDLINASGVDKVKVTFDKTGYASKNFSLSKENIILLNKPSGKTVSVETSRISDVTVFGPKSVVSKLKSEDIIAEYDMQGLKLENGNIEIPVNIYAKGYDTVWYAGDEKYIVVSVSEVVQNVMQNTFFNTNN